VRYNQWYTSGDMAKRLASTILGWTIFLGVIVPGAIIAVCGLLGCAVRVAAWMLRGFI
jgi:hypothetical protein